DALLARVVQLVRELSDEAEPDRLAPGTGDRDLAVSKIWERVVVEFVRAQSLQELTRARPGEVDGSPARGQVDDVHLVRPRLGPVLQRRLDGRRAGGRERDVPAAAFERADDSVVDDEAVLAEQQRVANAARLDVADPARVEALQELDRVGTRD